MKELIYKLADMLTFYRGVKRIISGFSLTIPLRYYKYFEPNYELNNINFINNSVTEGMTVIDVGAHFGLLSIIFSKKVLSSGKVFSFEPTPSTFQLLKKTIYLNNANNIIVPIRKAVSKKSGWATFNITKVEADCANSLSNNERGGDKKIDVELISIDELIKEHQIKYVDFIKIDAEGAEYSVLKGSNETIEKFHPKIILALHPNSISNFGDSLTEIWDFIISKKYKIIYKNDEINKDFFVNQKNLFDVFLI